MTVSEYLAVLSNPTGSKSSLLPDQEEYCLGLKKGSYSHLEQN